MFSWEYLQNLIDPLHYRFRAKIPECVLESGRIGNARQDANGRYPCAFCGLDVIDAVSHIRCALSSYFLQSKPYAVGIRLCLILRIILHRDHGIKILPDPESHKRIEGLFFWASGHNSQPELFISLL